MVCRDLNGFKKTGDWGGERVIGSRTKDRKDEKNRLTLKRISNN